MAPAVRCYGVNTEGERATEESVVELVQHHFPELSSAADLLFQLGPKDFGMFDYIAVVNDLCGRIGTWENSEHNLAVVWVEASLLMIQKLIQIGNILDATSLRKVDYAFLYKYCGADKSGPTRASSPLSITDIQLVYLEGMRLLVKHKLYKPYTGLIRALAREILTTSNASVAVHGVIGVANAACSTFAKVGDAMSEVPAVTPGYKAGDTAESDTAYPKEDVSPDLLQTMTGPLYGISPNLSVNAAICGNMYTETGEVDWPGSLAKYEQNWIWLMDWDVEGLCTDAMSATAGAICEQAISVSVGATQTPPNGEELKLEYNSARALITQAANDKTRIACLILRWDTDTENRLKNGRIRKLSRHSGWVCGQPDILREIVLATVSYFAYGLWPEGGVDDTESLWSEFVSYMGGMLRGYIIDHDTEADIGEHNLYTLLCKTCANASTEVQTVRPPVKKGPIRTILAQKLAWGAQSYFYYGRRHSGLARRVYSRKFRSLLSVQWGVIQCSDFLEPLATTEGPFHSLGAIIQHILRLTGITVDDTSLSRLCSAMPDPVDPVMAGMCANCRVDGIGLEMMIYGHGIMIMAAMLPESARSKFVWEMDGYGGRALPTLYSRILSGCNCSSFWMEEILQLGYSLTWSACGADTCYGQSIVKLSKYSVPEWLKTPRVSGNLKNLMAACQVEFESMPTVRDQLQSGSLDPSWCYLACTGKVKAILASQSSN